MRCERQSGEHGEQNPGPRRRLRIRAEDVHGEKEAAEQQRAGQRVGLDETRERDRVRGERHGERRDRRRGGCRVELFEDPPDEGHGDDARDQGNRPEPERTRAEKVGAFEQKEKERRMLEVPPLPGHVAGDEDVPVAVEVDRPGERVLEAHQGRDPARDCEAEPARPESGQSFGIPVPQ